jgi:sigma-B regulation protein RsbU (phosphoserine phosphatase)
LRILIAEDDLISRRLLEATVQRWGYWVIASQDGEEAWRHLENQDGPLLAILDWMMPGCDGLEVCRRARSRMKAWPLYIIMLTARGRREDLVAGLQAGADDYLTKPFDQEELRARLQVGVRLINLQQSLSERVQELEEALSKVKQLQGLLPICSYCKKIRNDQNYWQQVETYVGQHSEAQFSHSICPDCYEQVVSPDMKKWRQQETPDASAGSQ